MRLGRNDLLAPYGWVVPFLLGASFMVAAWRLGVGELASPGPGLWPVIASALVICASLALVFTEQDTRDYEAPTRGTYRVVMGLLSLVTFALLFELLGFALSTPLMFLFWLRVLGRESWAMTVLLTVAGSTVLYLLFVVLLNAPMPRGVLP